MSRLRDLEEARTFEQLWDTAIAALDAEGVSFVTYLTVSADYTDPFLRTTIPDLYQGYAPASDPFLHHCCTNYDITRTGAAYLADYPYLPEGAQAFIRMAEGVGFRAGLGIPVRLVGAPRFGGVNLGTRMDRAVFEDRIAARSEDFRLFALILHRRVEELARPTTPKTPAVIDVPPMPVLAELTPRERELIWLTAKGLTRKEIARSCTLSPHTVADYTQAAYRKLGVKNRVEATRAVLGL